MCIWLNTLKFIWNTCFCIRYYVIIITRLITLLWSLYASIIGRKKKDQHDANQAAAGLNSAYAGAYGAAPPVSALSRATHYLYLRFLSLFMSIEVHMGK